MSNGRSRFPMGAGLPPMPMGNGGGAPALQVAAPLNHFQLTALMASILMAREVLPDQADTAERDRQARFAVVRSLDILGHAAYYTGRGALDGTIKTAERTGQSDLKAAIEAEQSQPPDDPEAKIILDGG